MAKRTDEASHLTAARQGFGTPYYMPYEQAMNARSADGRSDKVNLVGLEKSDYKGRPSTLCQGCGHDSISSQIINVAFELSLPPT